MKQHILYRILTVLFGLCALTLAVLAVVSLLPAPVETGLAVKETIDVSSSPLDKEATKYVSQIRGILINESDKTVKVDAVKIKVSDGKNEREIQLEGFELPPRVTHSILHEWQDTHAYSRVQSVTAAVEGVEEPLANATAGMAFHFGTLILLGLCAVFALVTVHFGKQCYYLIQEDQLQKKQP